jgi:hypothetical protein
MKTYGKIALIVLIVAILVYLFAPMLLEVADKAANKVRTQLESVQAVERIKDAAVSIIAFSAALIVFSVFSGLFAVVGGFVLIAVSLIFLARSIGSKQPEITIETLQK